MTGLRETPRQGGAIAGANACNHRDLSIRRHDQLLAS
jgi:hypothetical protein